MSAEKTTSVPEDVQMTALLLLHRLKMLQGEPSQAKVDAICKMIMTDRERSQFEDIHTAPRDGTKVLCFSPGKKNAIYAEPRHPHFCVDEYRGEGRSGFYKMWPEAPYTHWMPLPRNPFAAAQGEAAVSTAPTNVSLPVTDERSGEGANAGGSHEVTGSSSHTQPSAVEPVSSSTEFAYLEDVGSGA